MQRKFVQAFHVPGALGADLAIAWTVPSDCHLVHVSAVNSTAYAAGLSIGTSAAATGWLTKHSIGTANTPVEFDLDDWDGTLVTDSGNEYPQFADGTIIALALDYNYNGGGAAQASADVTIVLTFQEG
jgi:hypothetical protein